MPLATAAERRSRQRADARRSILDAAEAILVEAGSEGFSIRRLADRCGYTAPSIYHHFGDKQGILDALLDERFAGLVRVLRRVPEGDDPAQTIRSQARAFVRFGLRNPDHYRLLTSAREPGAEPPPSAETARAYLDRPWLQLEAEGRLEIPDIETAQRAIWAMAHGLISLRTQRSDLSWSQAMLDESIDAVLRGLVAPPDAPRRARPTGERR